MRSKVRMELAAVSDVGLVREHNEDSFMVVDLSTGGSDPEQLATLDVKAGGVLLLVCDGMGGAAAGEVASAMAVKGMRSALLGVVGMREKEDALAPAAQPGVEAAAEPAPAEPSAETAVVEQTAAEAGPAAEEETSFADSEELTEEHLALARKLREAACEVNQEIFEAACADMNKAGMGTTLTAMLLLRRRVLVAQVGDSRAYLFRGGKLTQITHDQSLVNQLLDSGQITQEQARLFEHSNVILQALGVQEDVDVQISTEKLRRGDRILLCSDGLVGVVSDDEIQEVLSLGDGLKDVARTLVDMARAAGGPDNITVIVARVEGEGLPPAAEEDQVHYRPILVEPSVRRFPQPERDLAGALDLGELHREPASPLSTVQVLSMAWVVGLLLAGLVVGGLLYGRQPAAMAPNRGALCYLVAEVPDLDVLIDGQARYRSAVPGTDVIVSPGPHRFALHDPRLGVTGEEQAVHVSPGQRCAVTLHTPVPPFVLPAGQGMRPPRPRAPARETAQEVSPPVPAPEHPAVPAPNGEPPRVEHARAQRPAPEHPRERPMAHAPMRKLTPKKKAREGAAPAPGVVEGGRDPKKNPKEPPSTPPGRSGSD